MSPWFLLASMALATFILTKLIVDLDFPPVLWLRDRVVGGWRLPTTKEQNHEAYPTGQVEENALHDVPGLGVFTVSDREIHIYARRTKWVPFFFADLMSCPWCVSAYAAAVTVVATWAMVGLPVPVLMWPATWALGALLAQHEWD